MIAGRVLLVDPNEADRQTLAALLERAGYFPVQTADFAGAQNELDLQQFDLVITEHELPDGSGASLLHEVRRSGLATLVILTGDAERLDRALRVTDLGADEYLPKPFRNEAEVLGHVERTIRGARERNVNRDLFAT